MGCEGPALGDLWLQEPVMPPAVQKLQNLIAGFSARALQILRVPAMIACWDSALRRCGWPAA